MYEWVSVDVVSHIPWQLFACTVKCPLAPPFLHPLPPFIALLQGAVGVRAIERDSETDVKVCGAVGCVGACYLLASGCARARATVSSRGLNFYWFWKICKIVAGGKAHKEHVNEDKIKLKSS